jgi:glutathione synthase/RimK-type ligase-like ATP-grasp enzyme
MKIAIHKGTSDFSLRWIAYCEAMSIPFKTVNCYENNIVQQLADCDALMWHHSHSRPQDILIAKEILFCLEHTGLVVFPGFTTAWHFDDKVAQKYLFERVGAPLVPSYVFFDKQKAISWSKNTSFPKVFKLRGGAGSANVKLAKTQSDAEALIQKSFGKGFSNYDAWGNLKDRYRKYKLGKLSLQSLLVGVGRLFIPPVYGKVMGREVGYAYFQDFIPNNDSDIRIIVIEEKAFALKRFVRKGDFRASGSGNFSYAKEGMDVRCISISLEIAEKIKSQCAVFDFVFNEKKEPLIVELSYGFLPDAYDFCPGYWDKNLQWIEGKFNPQGWMVEAVVHEINVKTKVRI